MSLSTPSDSLHTQPETSPILSPRKFLTLTEALMKGVRVFSGLQNVFGVFIATQWIWTVLSLGLELFLLGPAFFVKLLGSQWMVGQCVVRSLTWDTQLSECFFLFHYLFIKSQCLLYASELEFVPSLSKRFYATMHFGGWATPLTFIMTCKKINIGWEIPSWTVSWNPSKHIYRCFFLSFFCWACKSRTPKWNKKVKGLFGRPPYQVLVGWLLLSMTRVCLNLVKSLAPHVTTQKNVLGCVR